MNWEVMIEVLKGIFITVLLLWYIIGMLVVGTAAVYYPIHRLGVGSGASFAIALLTGGAALCVTALFSIDHFAPY